MRSPEDVTAMRWIGFALAPVMLMGLVPPAGAAEPAARYEKVRKLPLGGEGGWDYLTVDPEARRLYISRGTHVVVLDLDRETVVGELADTPGVHGVAVVPDLGRGFTSNGGDASVTAFDLKTLKPLGRIKVGEKPDAIHYDPPSRRVFTFNHGPGKDATAVDPAELKAVGTLPLGGVPEAAASDGKGHVFVNLEDTHEVVEFDARDLKIVRRWPLAPGEVATGLGIDREHHRLFSACRNGKMVVSDYEAGKVIGSAPIGANTDGAAFDPEGGLAFSSNGGDGTLSIIDEPSPGRFRLAATVPTQVSAKTMALDPKTHRIYLSAATPAPLAPGEAAPKGRRRNYVPGSFVILVVGE